MSGVTPLVDTLLATKLSQRVDLLALRSQAGIAGPDAASPVEKVENDVRLPSRAAMERQLGTEVVGRPEAVGGAGQAPRTGEAATLSVAARAISAILGSTQEAGEPVRGVAPVWPASVAPEPVQLAGALARVVATSGLFYESHLGQFYAGACPLAQLAQEPQARLGALVNLNVADQVPSATATAQLHSASDIEPQVPERYQLVSRDVLPGSQHLAATIHPQAMALVRQQLELLATPVFRWTGEAWVGTPMDWQVSEQHGDEPEGTLDPAQRTWRTSVALTMPGLGSLQMMLSVTGSRLQVRLASPESATLALLRSDSEDLPRRFAAAGLFLTDLQVAPLSAGPGTDSVGG